MNVRTLAIVAVALAGAVGTTFAEASDRNDVHFSVASASRSSAGRSQCAKSASSARSWSASIATRRHPEPLRPRLQPALGP
jgi:hypothetical protein